MINTVDGDAVRAVLTSLVQSIDSVAENFHVESSASDLL